MLKNNKPDWKKAEHYPLGLEVHANSWALHFLYRNEKFLAEYNRAIDSGSPNWFMQLTQPDWASTLTGKVLIKYGIKTPFFLPFYTHFGAPYAALFQSYPYEIKDFDGVSGLGFSDKHAKGKRFYLREALPNTTALEFNLAKPIIPQIDAAKKLLQNKQMALSEKNKQLRKRHSEYHYYLRVLDAYSEGASSKVICDVLSLDYKSGVDDSLLRKWKNKAEELRDSGYKDMVYYSENKKEI
jgi:hypothetical protein